jgi:hypothetical protein
MSDIIRDALEAYLARRPTAGPTDRPTPPPVSDVLSDMSDRLTALGSDVSDLRTRLERLEAGARGTPRVRQPQPLRPTPRPTPPDQRPVPGRGLPRATLEAIADERTRCQGLSLRAFARQLFDTNIYRAKGDRPVDAGTLARWLRQAEAQGLL